jgi:hypothetical protein
MMYWALAATGLATRIDSASKYFMTRPPDCTLATFYEVGHASPCPLYLQKRTLSGSTRMSAKCQWRTLPVLFDHLIGGGDKRRWDGQAERLGGFEIDEYRHVGFTDPNAFVG